MHSSPEQARRALGQAVRSIRQETGLSQMELAFASDLHPTYISRVKTGARNPTWLVILRLADALAVEPAQLVARAQASLP